jgi:hypothetical protein
MFVIDGERFFILEPRNDALRWVRTHVPAGSSVNWVGRRTPESYRSVRWMVEGKPDVLVFEMFEANQSLSGVNWKNAYPSDPRHVYDGRSAERVAAIQALFRGTSDYTMVARFSERYLMPEYRVAMALLGDRSRSYITEVVVFARRGTPLGGGGSAQGGGQGRSSREAALEQRVDRIHSVDPPHLLPFLDPPRVVADRHFHDPAPRPK